MPDLARLGNLAEVQFPEIVHSIGFIGNKLRVGLVDGSYIDFWWSDEIPGRFAYHWERNAIDGTVYRHDNIPHLQWRPVSSFPRHFHAGSQQNVIESTMSEDPEQGLLQFLQFASSVMA